MPLFCSVAYKATEQATPAKSNSGTVNVTKVLAVGGLLESDIKPDDPVKFLPTGLDNEFKIETSVALDENQHKAWMTRANNYPLTERFIVQLMQAIIQACMNTAISSNFIQGQSINGLIPPSTVNTFAFR